MNPPTQRRPGTAPASPSAAVARLLTRTNLDRLILVLVIVGSAVAVWWSISTLRSIRQRSSVLAQQVSKLQSEIAVMQNQWPENRANEISRRFGDVPTMLFPGSQAVAEWVEETQRHAIPLALDVEVNLGSARNITNASGTVTVVRAHLDFPPSSDVDSPRTPYVRVLEFMQQLSNSRRRLDFLEASFGASSNSLDSASATVELWANESPVAPTNAPSATAGPQHAANP